MFYSIKHDVYNWWWNGERWTIFGCEVAVYSKLELPKEIKGMLLNKSDESDVSTWKYESEDRFATIIKHKVCDSVNGDS